MTDEKRFSIRKRGEFWVVTDLGDQFRCRTFKDAVSFLQWYTPASFR